MKRKNPPFDFLNTPCIITAVGTAKGSISKINHLPDIRADGYTRLDEANRFIRANLAVKKSIEYRRGERPKLNEINLDGKAIVCVLGHYLYLDHNEYYSFFDNLNDDVVRVWILKDERN